MHRRQTLILWMVVHLRYGLCLLQLPVLWLLLCHRLLMHMMLIYTQGWLLLGVLVWGPLGMPLGMLLGMLLGVLLLL